MEALTHRRETAVWRATRVGRERRQAGPDASEDTAAVRPSRNGGIQLHGRLRALEGNDDRQALMHGRERRQAGPHASEGYSGMAAIIGRIGGRQAPTHRRNTSAWRPTRKGGETATGRLSRSGENDDRQAIKHRRNTAAGPRATGGYNVMVALTHRSEMTTSRPPCLGGHGGRQALTHRRDTAAWLPSRIGGRQRHAAPHAPEGTAAGRPWRKQRRGGPRTSDGDGDRQAHISIYIYIYIYIH